jgi:adenylate cyclase
MSPKNLTRRLSAILSADVEGYSRLMREDEEATVRTITTHRTAMTHMVEQYRGRVVDSPGDNILAEFTSVVDAVNCSVEIQRQLTERNAELPENRRMRFRIGINLGDVLEEGERIYGDGINIAARMESLAEAGGICISGTVYDAIENKIGLEYEYLGEHEVKNIDKPIRAYKVVSFPVAAAHRVVKAKRVFGKIWRNALIAIAAILVIAAALGIWNFYFRPPPIEPASADKMAFPLPDTPSIAVLPFVNMSDDPKQEYFSDGMTEDLITDLSKISGLFVIARNSTFLYKGRTVKIRQVTEELGVRYVLEGSVRRSGDRVRINAQLIDAITGRHLWANRYDGSLNDVFSLQDKINKKIVAALAVKLTERERVLVAWKNTSNPEAYDEYLKGREHYSRFTKEDLDEAEICYKKALELAPNFTQALAALAVLYHIRSSCGLISEKSMVEIMKHRLLAFQYLREAMREPTPLSYLLAGSMDFLVRNYDEGLAHIEKAVSLDPNDPFIHSSLGFALNMMGRPREAIEHVNRAIRLDPLNPDKYLANLGLAQFILGNMEEAATLTEKAIKAHPDLNGGWLGLLASAYAHLGRKKEARAAYESLRSFWGSIPLSLNTVMYPCPFKDRRIGESFAEGLLKAGMPGQLSDYIHVSKEDQITGENLRSFYYPSANIGFTPFGQWTAEFAEDGAVAIHLPWPPGEDMGKSWLEGNTICRQYKKYAFGKVLCSTTFKNPRGTFEEKNEYIWFSQISLTPFSKSR